MLGHLLITSIWLWLSENASGAASSRPVYPFAPPPRNQVFRGPPPTVSFLKRLTLAEIHHGFRGSSESQQDWLKLPSCDPKMGRIASDGFAGGARSVASFLGPVFARTPTEGHTEMLIDCFRIRVARRWAPRAL